MRSVIKKTSRLLLTGIFLLSSMGAAGCNSSSSDTPPNLKTIPLAVGTEYRVYAGESVVPGSEDTEIEVRHEITGDVKYVTLLQGKAEILRKTAK